LNLWPCSEWQELFLWAFGWLWSVHINCGPQIENPSNNGFTGIQILVETAILCYFEPRFWIHGPTVSGKDGFYVHLDHYNLYAVVEGNSWDVGSINGSIVQ
jgi:hypothetical protein